MLATWTVRDRQNVSTPDKEMARYHTRAEAKAHAARLNLNTHGPFDPEPNPPRYWVRTEAI